MQTLALQRDPDLYLVTLRWRGDISAVTGGKRLRRQQANAWELRAAMSLARLWHGQGKQARAYRVLEPVYSRFTEGFDTADLQEAKAILSDLQAGVVI